MMSKNLPIIISVCLLFLIVLVITALFLLGNKNGYSKTHSPRIYIRSNIAPYTVKVAPSLDAELENIGFWKENAMLPRDGSDKKITIKKLLIDIEPISKDDFKNSTFHQLDKDGRSLMAGKFTINPKGEDLITIYLSNSIFGFNDPGAWIADDFWNVLYQNYLFPVRGDGNKEVFLLSILKKGTYFTLEK